VQPDSTVGKCRTIQPPDSVPDANEHGTHWGRITILCGFELLAGVVIYFATWRARQYGTTAILAFVPLFVSSYGLAVPRHRSSSVWLAGAFLAVTGIRAVSFWVDSTFVAVPIMLLIWCVASWLVLMTIATTVSALAVPLWPTKRQPMGRVLKLNSSLWLSVVFRPVAMLALPIMLTMFVWGFHWSHRSYVSSGLTVSSTVALACFVSIAYLAVPVLAMQKRAKTEGLMSPDAGGNINKRTLGFTGAIVFVWGLGVEWKTTGEYFLWAFLVLTLILVALLFGCLLDLKRLGQGFAAPVEQPWPRRVFMLHTLWLMFFVLIYFDLLHVVLP